MVYPDCHGQRRPRRRRLAAAVYGVLPLLRSSPVASARRMVCYSPVRGGGASRFESGAEPGAEYAQRLRATSTRGRGITTAMLPGGRGPAWVRRPNAAHRHDHRARVTQARLPRVVQCPPPTRSSRRDSSAKTCSGARGARCRQVVPLAARLDTRVPAGVAAVVRLSGAGPAGGAGPRLQAQQNDHFVPVQPGGRRHGQAPPEDRLPGTYPRPPPGRPAPDPGGGPLAAN